VKVVPVESVSTKDLKKHMGKKTKSEGTKVYCNNQRIRLDRVLGSSCAWNPNIWPRWWNSWSVVIRCWTNAGFSSNVDFWLGCCVLAPEHIHG